MLRHADRQAYGELVQRHQSGVRALLRRLTRQDTSLADDLAQDTFLQAFFKLDTFRGQARLSSWLYRIAYNAFLMHVRRSGRTDLSGDLESIQPTEPTPVGGSDLNVDLERAMQRLSAAERAAITLCYSLDHSHAEAAQILDCPVGTVKTHILRGKEKLRARLGAWQGKVSNA